VPIRRAVGPWACACVGAVVAAACAAGPALVADAMPVAAARVELIVLGVAQDGGLPHFGCERPCCADARRTGRVVFPAALGVVDRRNDDAPKLLLVEATPRIEEQVAAGNRSTRC
jgi:hypothetical protein